MTVASCDIKANGSIPDSMTSRKLFTVLTVSADSAKSSRSTNLSSEISPTYIPYEIIIKTLIPKFQCTCGTEILSPSKLNCSRVISASLKDPSDLVAMSFSASLSISRSSLVAIHCNLPLQVSQCERVVYKPWMKPPHRFSRNRVLDETIYFIWNLIPSCNEIIPKNPPARFFSPNSSPFSNSTLATPLTCSCCTIILIPVSFTRSNSRRCKTKLLRGATRKASTTHWTFYAYRSSPIAYNRIPFSSLEKGSHG
nr:hypothetical protein Iba_chr06bCG5290 [Ipomoea batatas]